MLKFFIVLIFFIFLLILYIETKNNKNFKPIYRPYSDTIEYEKFIQVCQEGELFISSIAIESDGARLIRHGFFDDLTSKIGLNPTYYCTVREPYDRAISLYYYINGTSSVHEPTHNLIKSASSEEYLSSYELEDSWLVRVLVGLEDNQEINEKAFEKSCQLLSPFIIKDVSKIDELMHEVFSKKFQDAPNILNELKTQTDFYKNKSEKKECPSFSDLKDETRAFFLERKKYDIRLYNKYAFNK